jgi:hypothetical protein
MTMNVRRLTTKGLLCAAIAVGTLPIAAVQAFAGGNGNGNLNGGCGAGFTESIVGVAGNGIVGDPNGPTGLTLYAVTTYGQEDPIAADWFAYLTGLDKNLDGSLCYHPTGKLCPCGANAINIVDDNANATFE